MQTIISISRKDLWRKAQKTGKYTQSTIHQSLDEIGFIHCTNPDQTMDIIPRFKDEKDVILLLIDSSKLTSELKFEAAKSDRPGSFPHIYGPLNTNAVYKVVEITKNSEDNFQTPLEISNLTKSKS